MSYTQQVWADNDVSKPVSAARMTIIENGINAAASTADGAATTASTANSVATTLNTPVAVALRSTDTTNVSDGTTFDLPWAAAGFQRGGTFWTSGATIVFPIAGTYEVIADIWAGTSVGFTGPDPSLGWAVNAVAVTGTIGTDLIGTGASSALRTFVTYTPSLRLAIEHLPYVEYVRAGANKSIKLQIQNYSGASLAHQGSLDRVFVKYLGAF